MASGLIASTVRYEPTWKRSPALGTGWTDRASMASRPANPAFSVVTENPAMSMSPQAAPVLGQKLSCTAPEPTMAKSAAQASAMTGWYSVMAASWRLSSSCLPLIPPAALHHSTKASPVSKISWFRPGRPSKPGSDTVPRVMVSSVIPWVSSGPAVDSSPPPSFGPHTPARSPKSPAPPPSAAVVSVVLSAPPDESSPRSPPQAADTSAATASTANRTRRFFMVPPVDVGPPVDEGVSLARI